MQDSSQSAGGGLFETTEDCVQRVTVVKFKVAIGAAMVLSVLESRSTVLYLPEMCET